MEPRQYLELRNLLQEIRDKKSNESAIENIGKQISRLADSMEASVEVSQRLLAIHELNARVANLTHPNRILASLTKEQLEFLETHFDAIRQADPPTPNNPSE